jgi:hypothetical protein
LASAIASQPLLRESIPQQIPAQTFRTNIVISARNENWRPERNSSQKRK